MGHLELQSFDSHDIQADSAGHGQGFIFIARG